MNTVKNLPITLGIRTSYKGYYYVVSSLELILQNEDLLMSIGTQLFPAVAERYRTDVRCIERNIRTVINACWESPSRSKLQSLCPYTLEHRPSVGEFLDILFWHIVQTSGK